VNPQDSFPRLQARTQRFTLGAPRNVRVANDGSRVVFCRSSDGDDHVNRLWVFDCDTGTERLVVDPAQLDGSDADLPAAERARRERAREQAGGIVAYDADPELTIATYAVGGVLYVTDLLTGESERLDTAPGVFDPRLATGGAAIAYVSGRELRVARRDGSDAALGSEPAETISWGSAEFVAAEEMGRTRGHWWSPDGTRLLAARVDVDPVTTWWIAAPAAPESAPRPIRYPAAGSTNAAVTLAVLGVDGADAVEVDWRRGEFEYVADVSWSPRDEPTIVAVTRDQRTLAVLTADAQSGECTEIHRQTDDAWVELVPGAPRWVGDQLLTVADRDSTRTAFLDGQPVTPPDLQVRRIVNADADHLVVVATTDATESHVYSIGVDGSIEAVTKTPGVHGAEAAGGVMVVAAANLDTDGTTTTVYRDRKSLGSLESHACSPGIQPRVNLFEAGPRGVNTAVLFPTGDTGAEPLPVLLDPYGGPHALRVQKARAQYLVSQWFADQGFAVVIADGRGTPARGPEWERAVQGDLAQPVLDDQVAALEAAAEAHPQLDLSRVAIRGWSFGGYLAALAVLRRPDVFHAAVAGAPVTDWKLYDTFYTERYLGHPDFEPDNYERCSLIAEAAQLSRPLLLLHGFADDNVVAAHTLKFSQALLEAGRPHTVLPLSGVTHMTPQEAVAENLLLLQLDFLKRALGLS
jgi:dipeptidyl-peptidase-4